MDIANIENLVLDRIESTDALDIPYIRDWHAIHNTTDRLQTALTRIPPL
jgi:hypothetical protein